MGVNAETPVRHSQICVGMSASAGMSGRTIPPILSLSVSNQQRVGKSVWWRPV